MSLQTVPVSFSRKKLAFLLVFVFLPVSITVASGYQPSKVVYDVSSPRLSSLDNIISRVGLLQKVYNNDSFEASIVVVVHEGAIPLFKTGGNLDQSALMDRARSLTLGEIVQFKICEASARMQKIKLSDLEDFVTMVPMADAELIKLQQLGYAYLQ